MEVGGELLGPHRWPSDFGEQGDSRGVGDGGGCGWTLKAAGHVCMGGGA